MLSSSRATTSQSCLLPNEYSKSKPHENLLRKDNARFPPQKIMKKEGQWGKRRRKWSFWGGKSPWVDIPFSTCSRRLRRCPNPTPLYLLPSALKYGILDQDPGGRAGTPPKRKREGDTLSFPLNPPKLPRVESVWKGEEEEEEALVISEASSWSSYISLADISIYTVRKIKKKY